MDGMMMGWMRDLFCGHCPPKSVVGDFYNICKKKEI